MARWPFAGRRQELERLSRQAQDTALRGVVIAGPAGVGKSRLAAEVLRGFRPTVFTVASIRATRAASGIPYGALAHLLPARLPQRQADGPVNPLRWAADAIAARGSRVVLAVDDAHLLDAASAAVVHHLVRTGRGRIVATLRTGEPAPDSVLALWKDGLATRVDVGPLDMDDTVDVLGAALGGPVDDAAVRRLWRAAEGNALLLYETVAAALESGTLTQVRGMWQMSRDAPVTPRLMDLIHDRVGALPEDVNAVLEYTALAEPLGLADLVGLCDEAAVDRAEERGLVRIAHEDGRTAVRLGHPIYGEIARRRCPRLRRRHRFAELVRVMEKTGARRREDALRLTVWRLESGRRAWPEPLLAGCRMAWAAHDYPLAIRLGRGAVEAGGGVEAAVMLATVLDYAQLPEEAGAVLAEAERTPGELSEPVRTRLALARASNLAWGMDRLDDALQLLDETEESLASTSQRQEIAVRRLGLIASAARPQEALQLSASLMVLAGAQQLVGAEGAGRQDHSAGGEAAWRPWPQTGPPGDDHISFGSAAVAEGAYVDDLPVGQDHGALALGQPEIVLDQGVLGAMPAAEQALAAAHATGPFRALAAEERVRYALARLAEEDPDRCRTEGVRHPQVLGKPAHHLLRRPIALEPYDA